MAREYDCAECGLCCNEFGATLYFYEEAVARWQQEKEDNILRRLHVIQAPAGGTNNGWCSPEDGQAETSCPFLLTESGCRCEIYPTRPLACGHFANGGSACLDLRKKHGLAVEDE